MDTDDGRNGEIVIFFSHRRGKVVGKGVEALGKGLRPQVVYCIQVEHVSDIQAKQEPHWVESITIGPPAEEGELGRWAG